VIEGKIFYQHGEYSISVGDLDADKLEEVIKALRGIVQFRRATYGGWTLKRTLKRRMCFEDFESAIKEQGYSIVRLNHYWRDNQRHTFCAILNAVSNRAFKAEGLDSDEVFDELYVKMLEDANIEWTENNWRLVDATEKQSLPLFCRRTCLVWWMDIPRL
jgi:hypothetical protein